MKERIISGVVLALIIIIIGILNNPYLIGLIIAAINIIALMEFRKIVDFNDEIFYFLSALGFLAIFINPFLIAISAIIATASYVAYYKKEINLIAPSIYPFAPIMMILAIYHYFSIITLFWLIIVVALTDIGAYFSGKYLGHKFFERGFSISSPNKTIEGVIGGVIVASIVGSIAGLAKWDFLTSLTLSIIISITSIFGDLFESYLKRMANIKDSGNIIPGHGGVLDRIDGYLFAATLLFAILQGLK